MDPSLRRSIECPACHKTFRFAGSVKPQQKFRCDSCNTVFALVDAPMPQGNHPATPVSVASRATVRSGVEPKRRWLWALPAVGILIAYLLLNSRSDPDSNAGKSSNDARAKPATTEDIRAFEIRFNRLAAVACNGDREEFAAEVRSWLIPDARNWFDATFDLDRAENLHQDYLYLTSTISALQDELRLHLTDGVAEREFLKNAVGSAPLKRLLPDNTNLYYVKINRDADEYEWRFGAFIFLEGNFRFLGTTPSLVSRSWSRPTSFDDMALMAKVAEQSGAMPSTTPWSVPILKPIQDKYAGINLSELIIMPSEQPSRDHKQEVWEIVLQCRKEGMTDEAIEIQIAPGLKQLNLANLRELAAAVKEADD